MTSGKQEAHPSTTMQTALHDSVGACATAAAATPSLTIGGAMIVVFLASGLGLSRMGFATPGGASGRTMTAWFVVLGLVTVLAPPFVGGAAWRAAIARIFGAPTAPAARTGALAFGGMVVVTAAGFLAGSALAVALGVRVFPWERLSMVWATVIALLVSTLAAGAMLGARLAANSGPTTASNRQARHVER